VVVVGASDDRDKLAGRPLAHLLDYGFAGSLFVVNPRRTTVQGLPSYPSVGDLPVVPDLAVLMVPAAAAEAAVRECAQFGVRVAIIGSAGFAESGGSGAATQDRIVALAREAGMRLLGPNCLGAVNSASGLCASFSATFNRGLPPAGPVGVVSQSGAYGSHVVHLLATRGLGVTYWMTTGNEADFDVAEGIRWMAERDDVTVILAYVEGIRDGRRFTEALRAAHASRTPVVLLKSGTSRAGERAANSHTGAFTGSSAVFELVARQYGAYQAKTVEEQIDIVYACARGNLSQGRRLGIVTVSGGIGAQLCDAADRYGLDVPELPAAARERVRSLLPYATATNPVDCTAQVLQDMDVLTAALETLFVERGFDALVAFFSTVLLNPGTADEMLARVRAALAYRASEIFVTCMVALPDTVAAFEDIGCLVFQDPDHAVRAIAALAYFAEAFDCPVPEPLGATSELPVLSGPFDEVEAASALAEAGIPVLPMIVATTEDEAVDAAVRVGLPVALKVVSVDVVHKSEAGGVALGLANEADIRAAFARVTESVSQQRPDAHVRGVLISPMAQPGGVETIIGTTRDPIFGPVVLLGLGGIFVETIGATVTRLAPIDKAEGMAMIEQLRGSALLTGTRGREPADVDALVSALVALSRFAADHPEVSTVEANPFAVWPDGAAALDAVLIVNDRAEEGDRP
jgi:acyl-CoA synthetase (NDP forming)